MILTRETYNKLRKADYRQMLIFCTNLYKQGFEDGANADVDDSVKYIAIKQGTEYICGNCGARLEFGEVENDS